MSKIKVLTSSGPDENFLPGLQTVTFLLCPHKVGERSLSISSDKTLIILDQHSTLMISCDLITSFIYMGGWGFNTWIREGGHNSVQNTCFHHLASPPPFPLVPSFWPMNWRRRDFRKQNHLYFSAAGVSLENIPQAWKNVNPLSSFRENFGQFLGDLFDMVAILSSCSTLMALSSTFRNSMTDLQLLPAEAPSPLQTTHLHGQEWSPHQV